jgi:hypothetical protein
LSKIEVNEIDKQNGSTVTIGGSGTNIVLGTSGQTVSLGTGASQSGFGRTGTVDWQTGSIKTGNFTAANGEGYFINSSGSITMSLPAGSAGAIVSIADYARNFATHNFIISPNGSEKIGGVANDLTLNIDGQALTLVYVDSTKGWINVQNAEDTEAAGSFISATGGNTVATVCTNFKVHTFTGPGTFCVSAGSGPFAEVDYLVIAGGGGGGWDASGGGGAGGYRFSSGTGSGSYNAGPGPLGASALPITPGAFPITVGAGGAAITSSAVGNAGTNSQFSTIISAGGGLGGRGPGPFNATSGGSGGGAKSSTTAGSGNTPPVTPPQGNDGATGPGSGGGGGGAGAAGSVGQPAPGVAGAGGDGLSSCITGSPVARGGGGAGGNDYPGSGVSGGSGGGGNGGVRPSTDAAGSGVANTGGGGGGAGVPGACGSGAGGSGVVIIRYRFQ